MSEQGDDQRKRKPKWDDGDAAPASSSGSNADSESTSTAQQAEASAPPAKKRSRWATSDQTKKPVTIISTEEAIVQLAAQALRIPISQVTEKQLKLYKCWSYSVKSTSSQPFFAVQLEIEELSRKLMNPLAYIQADPRRSPSPPPQYDSRGQRTNTRELRMRERWTKDRQQLVEDALRLDPNFVVPHNVARKTKFEKRMRIPQDEYPSYNFMGQILGPRGITHKELERKYRCKISIRGRGSVKEGRAHHQDGHENDPLHVYICAETDEDLESCALEIDKLLTPIDDADNLHKNQQLMLLAQINGTLRDEPTCLMCRAKGHRIHEVCSAISHSCSHFL